MCSGFEFKFLNVQLNLLELRSITDVFLFSLYFKVGVLLGGEPNSTREQMKAVLEFETKLANITTPTELRRDEETLYHPMTIKELQSKAGFVSCLEE